MRQLLKKIQRKLFSHAYIDLGGNRAPVVFLAGSPRSGTTWISELINFQNQYRYIFEPFHPRHGINLCDVDGRSYVRPENRDTHLLAQADSVLSGKIRSKWANKFNRKFICHKRLIKEVYGNLLIKWLKDNFPHIKMILVLRHPCAIASSQRNLSDWNFYYEPKQFIDQRDLVEDYLSSYSNYLNEVRTPFEKSVLTWCIDNYVPLKQFNENNVHLALYENFTENPIYELKRMFDFLGEPYDAEVEKLIKLPSMVTIHGVRDAMGSQQGWVKDCSDEEIDRAYEIMSWFDLDAIYPRGENPSLTDVLNF